MNTRRASIAVSAIAVSLSLGFRSALAQVGGGSSVGAELTSTSVTNLITWLSCVAAQGASLIAIIAIIVFGLQMSYSRGDAVKFSSAKKNLGWAVIGLLVVTGAYTIVATVANATGASFTLTQVSCQQDVQLSPEPLNPGELQVPSGQSI